MIYSCNKSQRDALFLKFILVKNSACSGQTCCPSSGVSALHTQQSVFVIPVMLTLTQNDDGTWRKSKLRIINSN